MSRDKTKEAKFFCESCGEEVPRLAKFCPKCGKFFASVRCPRCGKIGTNDDFKNGCPECGYAVDKETPIPVNPNKIKDSFFFEYEEPASSKKKSGGKKRKSDSQIPIWIPIICIVVLIGLIAGLYSCL